MKSFFWKRERVGVVKLKGCEYFEKEILFEITINDFALEMITSMNKEKLIELLKLRKKISLNNMHAFNFEGKIVKYNSVLDILKEFYDLRLNAYEKRRLNQIKILKEMIFIEESKQKFIDAVIKNKLKIYQLDDNKLISSLDKMKLFKKNGYDYLLNISVRGMTKKSIEKSIDKIKNMKKQLKDVNKISNKDMWLNELNII